MTSQAAIIAAPARPAPWRVARDLLVLTKPRITFSSTLAAAAGMAASGPKWVSAQSLLALLGISMAVAAACTLNMWFERDTDALMDRTHLRPLPSQRLEARVALGMALALAIAGLALVSTMGGLAAAGLSLAALLLYAFAYTPLKRITPAASLVGIIPGAMPPLIGAAVLGAPAPLAWALFGLLVFWQVPHLMAVALRLKGQYAAAHLHTLLDWLGERWTLRTMQAGLALLVLAAFVPAFFAPGQVALWLAGVSAGGIALVATYRSLRAQPELLASRWFIVATVLYVMPVVIGALAA